MRAMAMVCSAAFAQAATADEAQDNWPSLVEMLAFHNPDTRLFGAFFACAGATMDATLVSEMFAEAGWAAESGDPAYFRFAYGTDRVTFLKDGATCLLETEQIGTKEAAKFMGGPSSTNAEGCDIYDIGEGVILTVTALGPDPVCQSETGAALRFDRPVKV